MSCHGGFSLDENTRRKWFNPEKILQDIGLQIGMVFVDVGSGDGFFAILAAQVVGEKGTVYAVDVDSKAIERLKHKAAERNIYNIKALVGEAEDTIFCQQCADIVFYSIVLHDFHHPNKVLLNAKKMLKPNGKLVDLDWKKKKTTHGPPYRIRLSEKKATELIETAGFKVEIVADIGKNHYIIKAKPT